MGDNVDLREVITTITDNQIFNLNVSVTAKKLNWLHPLLPTEIINPNGTTEMDINNNKVIVKYLLKISKFWYSCWLSRKFRCD